VAQRLFDLDLELGLCFLAIGAAITANLVAVFVYPENKRLTESEVAVMLLFDISQLSFLLYPDRRPAQPLRAPDPRPGDDLGHRAAPGTTAVLGGVAIFFITIVTQYHVPLRTDLGFVMRMPTDFVFGFWVAIVIGVVFLAAFAQRVTAEIYAMSDALVATQMALRANRS
jgi:two-component system, sensor histidine kinase RegB